MNRYATPKTHSPKCIPLSDQADYSGMGLLNLKRDVFKFPLLLYEKVYFLFLFVVGGNTQSQDAAKEPLRMGSACHKGALRRRKPSESLRTCLCTQAWFGWVCALVCSLLIPVKPLGPSGLVMGQEKEGTAGREVGAEYEELCLRLLLQV